MIKLEINSQKELSISKSAKVFKGENLINSIQVTALNPYIGDKRVEDCGFSLHVVLPDKSYIVYPVTWSENSIPLTGFVPITYDITSAAQFLKLYVEITSGNTVIGKTNTVRLQVYDSPEEQTSITPREQLEEQIEALETELESADTLTQTLSQLSGSYDSFSERLSADESHIATNAQNITSNQSAIISLTAALGNKLSNITGSVSTLNIADSAVTTSKIADSAVTTAKIADANVTYDKLSTALQDVVDTVPENPMAVNFLGTLAAADVFDSGGYCTRLGAFQFTASGALAAAIGVESGAPCEIRYINGYQVVTQTDTQQIFSRRITHVAPGFQAGSWSQVIHPAITSLQTTVGTLNSQLESALNGGV